MTAMAMIAKKTDKTDASGETLYMFSNMLYPESELIAIFKKTDANITLGCGGFWIETEISQQTYDKLQGGVSIETKLGGDWVAHLTRRNKMGMTIDVVGVVPPDETWRKMKAIWDACAAAGIETPDEVFEYFDEQNPDPDGMVVDIPCLKYGDNSGLEIVVADIPDKVKIIRFINSW